jgi:antitoxin PrlF
MREITSTITSKGQVTIPAEIRRHLGVTKPGKVAFVFEKGGKIVLRPARQRSFLELEGTLPPLNRETEDFDDLIKEAFDEGIDKWLED